MSLHDAIISGNFPQARRHICRRVGINTLKDGETPLMLAVLRTGKEYLTQLLLSAGAQVDMCNEVGETALMLALHSPDNNENITILLHAKADKDVITRYGYRACDYALKHACYDWLFPHNTERRAVRLKLRDTDLANVEVLCREKTINRSLLRFLLLDAVYSEEAGKVELLLELGAPANCVSIFGWSVLMQAACRAHLDLVKLLLRYGADPTYRDHDGRSVLTEMVTCVPGLRGNGGNELIYCEEEAERVLGKERLAKIKAAQSEIERLIDS